MDIRDRDRIEALFSTYGSDIEVIIHTAAQPSHDWAATDPRRFLGQRQRHPEPPRGHAQALPRRPAFIFTSAPTRSTATIPTSSPWWSGRRVGRSPTHPYAEHGIDEDADRPDACTRLFGVSKVAADVLVQEYGRYFGMHTGCFRGGCLTGPGHSAPSCTASSPIWCKCAVTGQPYTVFGYKGKQVRDNIHSFDLVQMFWEFDQAPRRARSTTSAAADSAIAR